MTQQHAGIYGGVVWIISGLALLLYGILGLTQTNVPGVEELVRLVQQASGQYLYLGAFLAIFIEGLYFLGSFFPGTSLVLLIAILAQIGGPIQFALIMGVIFIGWTSAGLINVLGARYGSRLFHLPATNSSTLQNDAELTWFPAFRANTEVAQVADGHAPTTVFWSSTKIKLYTSAGAALYALIIPFFIDLQSVQNKEGFWGLGILATINLVIGGNKIVQARKKAAS